MITNSFARCRSLYMNVSMRECCRARRQRKSGDQPTKKLGVNAMLLAKYGTAHKSGPTAIGPTATRVDGRKSSSSIESRQSSSSLTHGKSATDSAMIIVIVILHLYQRTLFTTVNLYRILHSRIGGSGRTRGSGWTEDPGTLKIYLHILKGRNILLSKYWRCQIQWPFHFDRSILKVL